MSGLSPGEDWESIVALEDPCQLLAGFITAGRYSVDEANCHTQEIDPLDRGRIKVAQILLLALVKFVVFCVFTVSGHRGFFEVQSRWRPRLLRFSPSCCFCPSSTSSAKVHASCGREFRVSFGEGEGPVWKRS